MFVPGVWRFWRARHYVEFGLRFCILNVYLARRVSIHWGTTSRMAFAFLEFRHPIPNSWNLFMKSFHEKFLSKLLVKCLCVEQLLKLSSKFIKIYLRVSCLYCGMRCHLDKTRYSYIIYNLTLIIHSLKYLILQIKRSSLKYSLIITWGTTGKGMVTRSGSAT